MKDQLDEVSSKVLQRITPNKRIRTKVEVLAKKLEAKVAAAARKAGFDAVVRVEGSIAKDTWLSEEPDIDVFARLPSTIPRKSLGEVGLKIARQATRGAKQVERFAEHPYLEAFVEGVRVNIVPSYSVERGEWLSATDRTPFHTDYVNKHLTAEMRQQVRLAKRFLKGIGVYGAEIKIGGFSGYLSELLILHYGTFKRTVTAFAAYKRRTVIDMEDYYSDRRNELDLLFREPLLVIDPVDKARNVASAVQPEKLYALVAASRAFFKDPSIAFFYPPSTKPLATAKLRRELRDRGSSMVVVTFGKVNAVPDVLWGQLYKSQRSLSKMVQLNDFILLRDFTWSDEENLNMFAFEVEQRIVGSVKKHLGPPLERERECESFLSKYLRSKLTVCGPYVEGDRWVVEIRRKHVDIAEMLKERLKDGGRANGVAEQVSKLLKKHFNVLVNEEIVKTYAGNRQFAEFLTDYVSGKPKWLVAAES
jgi:tRNA nucleotidyltransferase (CCA-adding enzyme)